MNGTTTLGRAATGGWRRTAGTTALAAAVFALAALMPQAPAGAQGRVKQAFGEWEMRCETPPGAQKEQCALVQNLASSEKPNVTLLVIVLRTADGKARLLRVVAPLGILLHAGLGLKIDQTDIGNTTFTRCIDTGCVAEVVMDDNLIRQFKSGKLATFVVFPTPEEGVGVPVSLQGFAQGFDALP